MILGLPWQAWPAIAVLAAMIAIAGGLSALNRRRA